MFSLLQQWNAYMPTVTALLYLFRKIIKINRAIRKYGQPLRSSWFCHSWNNNKQSGPSQFFPRVAEVFVPELTEAMFGRIAHAGQTDICRFAFGSAVRVHERHEAKKCSQRECHICKAASQIDLQNLGAICENASCSRESMADFIDCAPTKPSPAKRRCFQRCKKKKAYHEKWPFVTIGKKDDTCVNFEVHSTVVIWLDWWTVERDRQTAFSAVQNG